MSKRYTELFIVDILVAIDKIKRYSSGFDDAQSFYHDDKSFDATMRELQIIGEATKHLLQANLIDESYRIIVDFRNVIVHEYFGVDADEIWDILQNELPMFEENIYLLLAKSDKNTITHILQNAQSYYHGNTLLFIKKLYKKTISNA